MNNSILAEKLKSVTIFKDVSQDVIEANEQRISSMHFAAGEIIINENELGDGVYALVRGTVLIHREGYTIAKIHEGNIFGEMSLFDSEPRSMSVSAYGDVEVLCIKNDAMINIMSAQSSVLINILHIMIQRLREQDNAIIDELRSREEELRRQVLEQTQLYKEQKDIAEEQRARAEQSERFEQEFLANMSHEIRTPMNAVIGMTNLLLDKNPREDQMKYLDGIRRASEILLVIINDILDLSKIEAGKMEIESVAFSIREVVNLVHSTLHVKADEKKLEILSSVSPDVPELVMGDPTRLNQILVNLMGNAIKFTERGHVRIAVSLSGEVFRAGHHGLSPLSISADETAYDYHFIEFKVEDSGKGMSEDQLSKIFQSFQQASSSTARTHGGTGLGLSISKQLVELQHGSISASSVVGRGSIFTFRIPYHLATQHIEKTESVTMLEGDKAQLSKLHILVVDDDEYNRVVATDTLELKLPGVRITLAIDGHEALELFDKHDFDMILMDVNMPRVDGYEATRRIRAMKSSKRNIPIIALTASAIGKDVDKCLDAGMNAYVVKPFRSAELLRTMHGCLAEHNYSHSTADAPVSDADQSSSLSSTVEHDEPTQGSSIDLSFLREFCEDDETRVRKYLGMYLKTSSDLMNALTQAVADENYDSLKRFAHTLKSQFMYLGMKEARDVALQIEEDSAAKADAEVLKKAVKHLSHMAKMSFAELEQYLRN